MAPTPRMHRLVLLALVSTLLLGGKCGGPEAVPLEELQRDTPPAFAYDLYSNVEGALVGERSGVLLVHRSTHLERVYVEAISRKRGPTIRVTAARLARQRQGSLCNSA